MKAHHTSTTLTRRYAAQTFVATVLLMAGALAQAPVRTYVIVDTGQAACYDESDVIPAPAPEGRFYGQDATYTGTQPRYQDNGDATITDLNTGLMWQKTPELENKATFTEAVMGASSLRMGGHDDWRLPTVKELYSLIDFRGSSVSQTPYIDTAYFDFRFGDESQGERVIDAQYWSSTEYLGAVFGGQAAVFGVNFADGRIKGYPKVHPRNGETTQFVRYVRGNSAYGVNRFVDNGDGTVTDSATGLMWMQADSGQAVDWEGALNYAEDLDYAGYADWRLPNAKELQSIVDYSRAPDAADPASRGPAIDPAFQMTDPESYFWTGTTLLESPPFLGAGSHAVYVAFGQAFGVFSTPWGGSELVNVHGAGAQRSDPKSGDPSQWSDGFGPQNDEIRIYNYARAVRDAETMTQPIAPPTIEQQPRSQTLNSGESIRLAVFATGTGPIEYQWQKDGRDIPGATRSSLVLRRVIEVNEGEYRCKTSNAGGTTMSAVADITVIDATTRPPRRRFGWRPAPANSRRPSRMR